MVFFIIVPTFHYVFGEGFIVYFTKFLNEERISVLSVIFLKDSIPENFLQ